MERVAKCALLLPAIDLRADVGAALDDLGRGVEGAAAERAQQVLPVVHV